MKRIFLITVLIAGLTAGYGFAQMGQGHMQGQRMYGDNERYEEEREYGYPHSQGMGPGMMGGYGMHPCMMGGGMMGGMMGPGMMGQGHMGGMMGPGMMGQGHMGGMMGGYGQGSRGYDSEEYEKYQKEYTKYLDDTAGLRKKLHNKKFEYYEAARNPKTTPETMLKIEKEIRDLQWELYEKAPR